MKNPAQQKPPEPLARLGSGVPASIYQKDSLMLQNIPGSVTDWRTELIMSPPGLPDPAEAQSLIERINDREQAARLVPECVPEFPAPTLAAPEWVDEVGQWEWLGPVDRQWARRTSKEIEVPNSDGGTSSVSLSCWQYGDEGGSRTDPSSLEIEIETEDITTIRGLAAWFSKVADIIESGAA